MAFSAVAQPYGLDQRPAVGPFLNGALPPVDGSDTVWSAVVAFPNLSFTNAVGLVPQPRTNRLVVLEREGRIYSFPNVADTTNKTLFLNLSARTQGYNDSGLLGLAFHPQFAQPGSSNRNYVYIYYNYTPSPVGPGSGGTAPETTRSYNRLSRFTVPDGAVAADPASELVLINQYDEHLWHNGGGIFFGADGFLYLSNGDEGGSNDSFNNSQQITNGLFSGILRIDVDKDPGRSHPIRRQPRNGNTTGSMPGGWPNSFTTNYYIPNDNPWLATNGSVLEEFYAIGLRSPHRMTYDALSDRIWLGDVGQASWEEVSIIEKGGNYQWAFLEGTHANTDPTKANRPSQILGVEKPPVYEYPHQAGGDNCVIGGFVYRGAAYPSLYGNYIFGDNGSGRIWMMQYDGVNPTTVTQLCTIPEGVYSLTSFGLDQSNELYMCVFGDGKKIYKLAPSGPLPSPPPALLSQTGAFTNLTTLDPSPALVPYDVNTALWSDNAAKLRWLAVPTNAGIGFSSNGNWTFPTGTVLVKHFSLPLDDTNAALQKRLETRFLVLGTNGSWFGFTYKWRPDNSDADLLPGSLNETNLVTTVSGVRTQVWYYPSRSDCMACHNVNAGAVLGPRTSQFNGDCYYPATGRTDNQLRALNHIGMFTAPLNEADIPDLPKSVAITNTAASPEIRVRSYLSANCAHCHQPNGARGFFDARFSTPLTNQNIINGAVDEPLGISGARVVKPQSLAQSILYVRDSIVGQNQMPPLAKNLVDTNYIAVLAEWINGLSPVIELPSGSPGTVGNVVDGGSLDTIWDNGAYINAARFQASSNVTAALIRAKVGAISGSYKCAIYSDAGGVPGGLLGETATVTGPTAGWKTFPVLNPATLTNGSYYWLAIWSDDANAKVYYSGAGGSLRWGQYDFGIWPATLTTTGSGNVIYCINAYSGVAPVFAGTPINRSIPELTSLVVTNVATDADLPAQSLDYYLLNPPAGAVISSNGIITWTPTSAQGPSTNQIVTAVTDGVFSRTNVFQVIVTAVNQAPVAQSQSVTNAEDLAFGITLVVSDADGPVTNYMVLANPLHGILSGVAPNLTYTPVTNYFGPDSFDFVANDGSLTSGVATVSILLTNVNDAPVAGADALVRALSQGVSTPVANLLTNDTDVDGDFLALSGVSDATPTGATVVTSNSVVTYWPPFGNTNAGGFTYVITDGHGAAATGLVAVAVQADPAGPDVLSITATNGASVKIMLNGVPGFAYTVQSATGLNPPDWQNLTTATADDQGRIEAADSMTGMTNKFYRAVRGIVP